MLIRLPDLIFGKVLMNEVNFQAKQRADQSGSVLKSLESIQQIDRINDCSSSSRILLILNNRFYFIADIKLRDVNEM